MVMFPLLATTTPPVDYRAQESASSFPPFDVSSFTGQLIWLVLTFVPFYFVLSRVVLPKLQQVLDQREQVISEGLAAAAKAAEDARQAILAQEAKMAEARHAAEAMALKSSEEARQSGTAHRKDVEAEIADRLMHAERQIQEASARAIKLVPEIARDVAADLIDRFVGIKPSGQQVDLAIRAALAGPQKTGLERS